MEARLGVALFIGEEGADPRPGPAKNRDNKGDLDFIMRMGEVIVVGGPEGRRKLDQLLPAEEMLRLLLVHDQALFGQSIPHPLVSPRSARRADCRKWERPTL